MGVGAPTDIRLAPLGLPLPLAVEEADDPGEPADQSGDPELDIDQDLDRAADPLPPDERSRALELPGLGLSGLELSGLELSGPGRRGADDLRAGYADRDTDMSGPFGAVDATGGFSGMFADVALDDADETGLVPATEMATEMAGEMTGEGWAERTGLRYGDRVEGWIRPRYQDEPAAVAGEYWTPVPMGSYETEYGWPTPVERLPEIPPYPPATGFDAPVEVEAEPTKPVPQWPPARPEARIELPRSWSERGETGPAFRTAVDRGRPVGDPPAEGADPDPVAGPPRTGRFAEPVPNPSAGHSRTGRFGIEPGHREKSAIRPDHPAAGRGERPSDPPQDGRSEAIPPDGRPAGANRVPSRRGSGIGHGGTYAAPEESLDGPIWAVPDLPEAAMPDLAWSPGEADEGSARGLRRPAVMIRGRRSPGAAGAQPADEATQALPPMELSHPDQRARPRPRPRPGNGQQEPRSTVYVSRHAAEPS